MITTNLFFRLVLLVGHCVFLGPLSAVVVTSLDTLEMKLVEQTSGRKISYGKRDVLPAVQKAVHLDRSVNGVLAPGMGSSVLEAWKKNSSMDVLFRQPKGHAAFVVQVTFDATQASESSEKKQRSYTDVRVYATWEKIPQNVLVFIKKTLFSGLSFRKIAASAVGLSAAAATFFVVGRPIGSVVATPPACNDDPGVVDPAPARPNSPVGGNEPGVVDPALDDQDSSLEGQESDFGEATDESSEEPDLSEDDSMASVADEDGEQDRRVEPEPEVTLPPMFRFERQGGAEESLPQKFARRLVEYCTSYERTNGNDYLSRSLDQEDVSGLGRCDDIAFVRDGAVCGPVSGPVRKFVNICAVGNNSLQDLNAVLEYMRSNEDPADVVHLVVVNYSHLTLRVGGRKMFIKAWEDFLRPGWNLLALPDQTMNYESLILTLRSAFDCVQPVKDEVMASSHACWNHNIKGALLMAALGNDDSAGLTLGLTIATITDLLKRAFERAILPLLKA